MATVPLPQAPGLQGPFRDYGRIVTSEKAGRVIHATHLTSRKRQILNELSLPTPTKMLRRIMDQSQTDQWVARLATGLTKECRIWGSTCVRTAYLNISGIS
jgi:hypothetical protein